MLVDVLQTHKHTRARAHTHTHKHAHTHTHTHEQKHTHSMKRRGLLPLMANGINLISGFGFRLQDLGFQI